MHDGAQPRHLRLTIPSLEQRKRYLSPLPLAPCLRVQENSTPRRFKRTQHHGGAPFYYLPASNFSIQSSWFLTLSLAESEAYLTIFGTHPKRVLAQEFSDLNLRIKRGGGRLKMYNRRRRRG